MLEIQTRDCRMLGSDESTELWLHQPSWFVHSQVHHFPEVDQQAHAWFSRSKIEMSSASFALLVTYLDDLSWRNKFLYKLISIQQPFNCVQLLKIFSCQVQIKPINIKQHLFNYVWFSHKSTFIQLCAILHTKRLVEKYWLPDITRALLHGTLTQVYFMQKAVTFQDFQKHFVCNKARYLNG